METEVANWSADKKYFKTEKKELILENNRLLEHIIYQDVMNVVMHADVHNVLYANNSCLDNDNLSLELLKIGNDSLIELLISQDLEKNVVERTATVANSNVVTSKVYKLDSQPLSPRVKNNRDVHVDYLKVTQEHTKTLWDIVKQARALKPLDNALDYAYVKHYVLNTNTKLVCASCNECMFDVILDLYVRDYLNDVNVHVKANFVKSKSAKSNKKKIWKPTSKVYTNDGYSWKPTRRIFTIDGNTCPLTRIISTTVVPPRKSTLTTIVKQTKPSSNKSRKLKDIINVVSNIKSKTVGKSKKHFHKPKVKDTNQEKLYLLHVDLYGPMREESINRKKYILVIIDDYSRFKNVRTDTKIEFVNQTLKDYYENIRIIHQTSVARTTQQNGIV
nr:hypothetical protein [Tanacetum cinerariifolium]